MKEQPDKRPDLAIALSYDGENAPRVTASGRSRLAEQMVALAEEHGIPLHDDPELAALLAQIPLGDEIPRSLYLAVAEVIAFAYLLSGKRPPGYEGPSRQPASRQKPEADSETGQDGGSEQGR